VKIPKQVTVGKKKIKVIKNKNLRVHGSPCRGCYDYAQQLIVIAEGNPSGTRKYSNSQKSNTFWHELTHAILGDMDSGLAYNERFVSRFADRLDQAIKTAKFE
jgi:hypothetical protein